MQDFSKNKNEYPSTFISHHPTNKILERVEALITHLDQGDYDYCLDFNEPEECNARFVMIHTAIKNIAMRQLRLKDQENPCHDCVSQAVNVAQAIHRGEMQQRMTCNHPPTHTAVDSLKCAINTMADQIQLVTSNAFRVAHETAIEGKLGVQAELCQSTQGVWRDFILNLNSMNRNHLEQVRDITDVSTAIARGDLSKAMTVPVRGETLVLKNTFNTMGKKKKIFFFLRFFF